jgi:hypothetical protein
LAVVLAGFDEMLGQFQIISLVGFDHDSGTRVPELGVPEVGDVVQVDPNVSLNADGFGV